jgi:hypothetical protein
MTSKFKKAQRDPRINANVKRALESWATCQPQSARTLRIDDGRPPADNNAFVVSTGLLLIGHYSHDYYDREDRDNCDDRKYREDRNDRNDRNGGVITIDSRTEPAEALTVLAVDDTNPTITGPNQRGKYQTML